MKARDPEDENVHLSYLGNDLPRYVIVMWVVSMAALAFYTATWYLPSLSKAFG